MPGRADSSDLHHLLRTRFRLDRFRPVQEPVCEAIAAGRDVLVVMPTGAGKSLCYQLPGLARQGTTLVISPLIALMEDQVAKLRELGLAAERIHSGRSRADSRAVCRAYLDGELELLFIAPERLRVPGFPEMLAQRELALVAVDEAHCISHWGHDFRPDYRLLGERLPALRPAPVAAFTATATSRVQADVVSQLGMERAERFIHGFRRDNIGVEVAERARDERPEVVETLLAKATRRPAIVYTPSRRAAEELGERLARRFPAAAYHAGMASEARDRVQAAFQAGELEVIVATIAFGMGIDKPDVRTVVHTGLPGSLEAYYQEIGRAGRDGDPSRAVLLYSWADRRTHEYFHEESYPPPARLERVARALSPEPEPMAALRERVGLEEGELHRALEKLWVHGGATVVRGGYGEEPVVSRGGSAWREPYAFQRDFRLAQLDEITAFAEGTGCRMLHLVEHFGDQEDSGHPCGICDVCSPDLCTVRRFRPPDPLEAVVASRVLDLLRENEAPSTGQLHRWSCGEGSSPELDRRSFEKLLAAMAREELVELTDDSFEKDGETIRFRRAALTVEGYRLATSVPSGALAGEMQGELLLPG